MDSLGFFTSVALGFVPKDPLGLDFKPKQNFKKNLKTCLRRARLSIYDFSRIFFWGGGGGPSGTLVLS